MRFWPVKFRFVALFAFLGVGLWLSRGYWTEPQDQLVAIDAKTGQILWNRPLPKRHQGYPPIVLSGDRLLVTENGENGCFWNELNQRSGELIWRKSLKELGLDGCPRSDMLGVAQDGQFYTFWQGRLWDDAKFEKTTPYPQASPFQQAIVAMDFNNHKVRWVSPLQSKHSPMPSQFRLSDSDGQGALIIRSNQIFAAMNLDDDRTIETELRALRPESGITLWQKRLKGKIGKGFGSSNINLIDYKSSAIFYWEEWKGDSYWSSYDTGTGELEASFEKIEGGQITRHSDRIYNMMSFGEEAIMYLPIPGKHILNDLTPKVSVKHPWCNFPSSSSMSIYPSKSHFIGFCEANQVVYNDPKSNQLFAVDDQTGKQKWQLHVPSDDMYYHPNHEIVVVSDDGEHLFLPMAFRDSKSLTPHLQSITTEDGKQVWRLPINPMKPVISGDRLFVKTRLPRWRTWTLTRPRPLKP
jgi:outer membrane protein assembly factor BamB